MSPWRSAIAKVLFVLAALAVGHAMGEEIGRRMTEVEAGE